jgi:biotin operon repressor
MRSDRLLSILLLLQTRGQLPASELAERLEVSVRTVMRDVEALSAAGVPVYTVRGPHGGIALLPGYRTDVTGLTAEESRALFVLLSGRAHAELGLGQAIGSALRKLMAALPAPYRPDADLASRRILIDPARWREPSLRPAADLSVLQQAVFADRRLRLRYRHSEDGRVRSYTLDPYGLVNKAGVWYLVADHRGEPSCSAPTASTAPPSLTSRSNAEMAWNWPRCGTACAAASTTSRPRWPSPSASAARSSADSSASTRPTSPAQHPPNRPPRPAASPSASASSCSSAPWGRPRRFSCSAPTPRCSSRPNSARTSPAEPPKPPPCTPPPATERSGHPRQARQ